VGVRVRRAKRGRSRTVPLTADALDALLAWRDARPECPAEGLSGGATRGRPSCPRTAAPRTCCATPSAPTWRPPGVQAPVIRELAGHADMRTTSLFTDVDPAQLQAAIGRMAAGRRGLRRAARA
jgi:integrase